MAYDIKNKKILITGSTDGLGRLLALESAKLGANVIIHGRNLKKINPILKELSEINKEIKFDYVVCDLNEPASISPAFSKIKDLDILVNNAGIWQEGKTTDVTPEKIIEVLNVNLGAPVLITRVLLPVLQESEFSQILNVSSIAGVEIPTGYYHTIYSATKWGVQAFSESIAKEFDNTNLRVMGYYPGGMETKLFKKANTNHKSKESWMFDPAESVEAMIFMLTRDKKINIKRMDLINHLQI